MTAARCRLPAWLVIAVATALALGLRLPKLTTRAFWYDEVYQVYVASAPTLGELGERVVVNERNPPTGYLFTRAGLAVSDDEFGARLPSLVFGVLCVPLGWAAGRLWGDRTAAFWVAAFAAAAPTYVFYSREARVYAPGLAVVFGLIAATGWFRAKPTVRTGAVFALAAVAAASLQYAGAIVTAVWLLAAWPAVPPAGPRRTAYRGGWLVAAGLSAAAVAVWVLGFMLPQVKLRGSGTRDPEFANYFWDPDSAVSAAAFFAHAVPGFVTYPFLGGETGPRWALLALAAAAPALLVVARCGRDPRARTITLFTLGSVTAFVLLAGLGKHPFGGTRHCLPLTAGLLLLVGMGLSRVARFSPPVALGWGVLGLALMAYGTVHTGRGKHEHHVRQIAERVAEYGQPGIPVLVVDGAVNAFRYYEPQLRWPGPVVYAGAYLSNPPEHEVGPAARELLNQYGRVWVVELTPFDPAIAAALDPVAEPVARDNETGVRAVLWARREGPR